MRLVQTVLLGDEFLAEQDLAHRDRILGALRLGDRAHERLVGIAHMRIDHLEMALVDGQIDGLADRAAGMVDERREIGELHEILEILDRAVAASMIEIVHERRAVIGREHRRVAADQHVALGIARMLDVARGRRGAELAREPAREPHALALDVGARVAKARQRGGIIAEVDADLLQQRLGVALDDREPFLAQDLGRGDRAGDVGDRGMAAFRARDAARLAASARLRGGALGGRRGRHGTIPLQISRDRDCATTRKN